MTELLISIGVIAFAALVVYAIVKEMVDSVRRHRFHKRNRESQFSGKAFNKERSIWESVISGSHRSTAEVLGDYGERRMAAFFEDLPSEDYFVFNDILIRDGNYTTQIDHVIISRYGVFVIETKNIHGRVYGTDKSEYWSQYLPDDGFTYNGSTKKFTFRNPVWQNGGHIRCLRQLVFGYEVPVYGIVVFSTETELRINSSQPVMNMWDVVPYIRRFQDVVLSMEQMLSFRETLLEHASREESDRELHLVNIAKNKVRRNERVASGVCPLCGRKLVLRSGKYGQFWGCSGYPNCDYILKS